MGTLNVKLYQSIIDRLLSDRYKEYKDYPYTVNHLVTQAKSYDLKNGKAWNIFRLDYKVYKLYTYEYSLFLPYNLIVKV